MLHAKGNRMFPGISQEDMLATLQVFSLAFRIPGYTCSWTRWLAP